MTETLNGGAKSEPASLNMIALLSLLKAKGILNEGDVDRLYHMADDLAETFATYSQANAALDKYRLLAKSKSDPALLHLATIVIQAAQKLSTFAMRSELLASLHSRLAVVKAVLTAEAQDKTEG